MVEINLLPWRDYEKLYLDKRVKQCVVGIFMVVIFVGVVGCLGVRLAKQITQNNIVILQENLRKDRLSYPPTQNHIENQLLLTMERIKTYQFNLLSILIQAQHLKNSPQCVSNISIAKDKIKISGFTMSGFSIAKYLLHWQKTSFFDYFNLIELRQNAPNESAVFLLFGKLKKYPVWNAQYELDQDIIED